MEGLWEIEELWGNWVGNLQGTGAMKEILEFGGRKEGMQDLRR